MGWLTQYSFPLMNMWPEIAPACMCTYDQSMSPEQNPYPNLVPSPITIERVTLQTVSLHLWNNPSLFKFPSTFHSESVSSIWPLTLRAPPPRSKRLTCTCFVVPRSREYSKMAFNRKAFFFLLEGVFTRALDSVKQQRKEPSPHFSQMPSARIGSKPHSQASLRAALASPCGSLKPFQCVRRSSLRMKWRLAPQ